MTSQGPARVPWPVILALVVTTLALARVLVLEFEEDRQNLDLDQQTNVVGQLHLQLVDGTYISCDHDPKWQRVVRCTWPMTTQELQDSLRINDMRGEPRP